jgi:hypothetical protein
VHPPWASTRANGISAPTTLAARTASARRRVIVSLAKPCDSSSKDKTFLLSISRPQFTHIMTKGDESAMNFEGVGVFFPTFFSFFEPFWE